MRADQVLGTKHERTIGFHEKEPSLPQYSPAEEMAHAPGLTDEDYEGKPTEEERVTLRRVAGSVPLVAYVICAVEFSERASYFGVSPLISVSIPVLGSRLWLYSFVRSIDLFHEGISAH